MSEGPRVESKVRLDPELAEILRKVEFDRKITRQQLIVDAIWFYLEKRLGVDEPPTHGPKSTDGITPHDQHERELVAGLLLLFRDKRDIAAGVKEIVAGLLSNWINKARAAMPDLNGGKRSA